MKMPTTLGYQEKFLGCTNEMATKKSVEWETLTFNNFILFLLFSLQENGPIVSKRTT